MNQKNLLVAFGVIIVMLVALIFYVKKDASAQAREHVKAAQEKLKYQIGQVNDNIENNNLLWTLVDNIWKSPDKSKAYVKKLAESQKLPRCNGKECTGDDARLKTTISDNAKERSITVKGGRYQFKVLYDDKNRFVTIDADDLLGKAAQEAPSEEEETEAE